MIFNFLFNPKIARNQQKLLFSGAGKACVEKNRIAGKIHPGN